MFVVVFLSLLLACIYSQFTLVKTPALYDEYVLNLYKLRLDTYENLPRPPLGSRFYGLWLEHNALPVDSPRNVYRLKFAAAFGRRALPEADPGPIDVVVIERSPSHDSTDRIAPSNVLSPVFMLTALYAVGWAFVLRPSNARGLLLVGSLSDAALSTEVVRYAFVGAYSFSVQALLRRSFQADLKLNAYIAL